MMARPPRTVLIPESGKFRRREGAGVVAAVNQVKVARPPNLGPGTWLSQHSVVREEDSYWHLVIIYK